jgi:hypothetical protein
MRISETKEVEKKISMRDACMYQISDNFEGCELSKQAFANARSDGYVRYSVHLKDQTRWYAMFSIPEEREMTQNEERAWNYLKILDACGNTKERCGDCIFAGQCFITSERNSIMLCELKNKEIIE